MKMRTRKRFHQCYSQHRIAWMKWNRWIESLMMKPAEPTGVAWINSQDQVVSVPLPSAAAEAYFSQDGIGGAPQVYTVARKTTGEVVGTFESVAEAEAMVERARRQKRAALVLL